MPVNLSDADPRSLIATGQAGLLEPSGTYDVERYPWAYGSGSNRRIGWEKKYRSGLTLRTGLRIV